LAIDEYQEQCKDNVSLNTFKQLVASVQLKEEEVDTLADDESSCTQSARYSPYRVEMAVLEAGTTLEDAQSIDVKKDQRSDPYIAPIIEVMERGKVLDRSKLSEMSKLLWRERKRLSVDSDGILRRKCKSVNQIVLPLEHRDMIYKSLHNDLGHLGSERVLQLARNRVFWPRMQKDVEEYTQKRCRCLIQKKSRQQEVAPLVSIHSSTPMELIAFDFLKLEKSSGGYEYILLIVDHFTRYAQAFPTKNKYAKTAAKHIFNDFILKFGLPARVLHDQGREFDNRLFRELENYCGIVKTRTTPYHPQTNGSCERMNSTVLHMLRTLAESEKPRWHEHVDKLMHAYNSTTHSTTGYSPHFLLFGREPVLPLDLVLTAHARPKENVGKQYSKFVEEWESRMTEAYNIAKERCDKVKSHAEDVWKRRKMANKLHPGDRVLVRNKRETGGPGKLRSCWESNVFVVKEDKENGVVYEVENLSRRNDIRTLHRNMLLPCDMLEESPVTTDQPTPTKQTIRRSTRTERQNNPPEERQPVDDTSSDEDEFYPYSVPRARRMETETAISNNDGEDSPTRRAPIRTAGDPPIERPDPVPSPTYNDGVEDASETEHDDEGTATEETEYEDNEVGDGPPTSSDGIDEPMQVDDGEGPPNNGKLVTRTGRTLRSQRRNLKWNPAMGDKAVIVEEPIVEEPSCRQTDNTGEVDVVTLHPSGESGIRGLFNYCSETVCDWLELFE
jgi:transposase InsO family protein